MPNELILLRFEMWEEEECPNFLDVELEVPTIEPHILHQHVILCI